MKYILIALTFLGCIPGDNESIQISTEPLDTIKTAPATIIAAPELFETAFIKGTTQKVNNSVMNLYGITIGKLKVPTGRLIACDPMHIDEYGKPFTQLFPTGEFPVQLSIAKMDAELIAFARVYFSDEPVTRWEFALLEGQTPLPVGGKKMHGYSVDASTGIFIDEQASKALDMKTVADYGDHSLYKAMDEHYRKAWRFTMFNFGNHNLAAFTTGFGDGRFATYIGFDAKGQPCRLLTDFNLFDWKQKKD